MWCVKSRIRRSSRDVPDFHDLTCAVLRPEEEACDEGSGARGVLVFGGWDRNAKSSGYIVSQQFPNNEFKTYPLASRPCSVCCTSFAGDNRIVVGSADGCIRMLDAGMPVVSEGAEPFGAGACSPDSGLSDVSDAPKAGGLHSYISTVTVMTTTEIVVAGHRNGRISLWRAESGEFVRAFEDERGDCVHCVDFSVDERLTLSGHENGVALVWSASKWECLVALEGSSGPVICATIASDAKRMVTVDDEGELRLWNTEIGGAALWMIGTGIKGIKSSGSLTRGAISLDGGLFMWAGRIEDNHRDDWKWRCKVIDLKAGIAIPRLRANLLIDEVARHFDWDPFLKQKMSDISFGGEEEVRWKPGAVWQSRSVYLRDADSGQQSPDVWRISSSEPHRMVPRIDCALLSADDGTIRTTASLGFDSCVLSIAVGRIPREAGGRRRRRAVVACQLQGRYHPSIMHFYHAND